MKIYNKFIYGLVSLFSLQTLSVFATPNYQKNNFKSQILIAELDGYREHYLDEDENNPHSKNHNWEKHYHSIESIRLKSNGDLKIKFCEGIQELDGQVLANNTKYDVNDAFTIKKRSVTWKLDEKNTFKKDSVVNINTANFLGRPIERDPNYNNLRSLERGCSIPYGFIPNTVQVKGNSIGFGAILGLALLIGIGAGSSGSGSGGTSSN